MQYCGWSKPKDYNISIEAISCFFCLSDTIDHENAIYNHWQKPWTTDDPAEA
jgi:hypothetical protein